MSKPEPILKAPLWSGYLVRMLLLAGMMTLGSAWFLKDGFFTYPRQAEIHAKFEAYRAEGTIDGVTASERWDRDVATPGSDIEGFPKSKNGQNPAKERTPTDILTQKIIGFGLLPVALISLAWLFLHIGRWIGMSDQAVLTSSGQIAPISAITKLDKSRWQKKGIAVVHYMDPEKQIEQQITLDDWKFDRETTRTIVSTLEQQLPDDQIIGGPREEADEVEEDSTGEEDGDTALEGAANPGSASIGAEASESPDEPADETSPNRNG